jgi:AraC-like DNA-binding protein
MRAQAAIARMLRFTREPAARAAEVRRLQRPAPGEVRAARLFSRAAAQAKMRSADEPEVTVYEGGLRVADEGWTAAVSEHHGRLQIARSQHYRGRLSWQRSARHRMVCWSGDEEGVHRDPRDVRRDPRETFSLFVALRGRARVEQGGQRVDLARDTMVLCPADRATAFWHEAGFAALALIVPEASVLGRWSPVGRPTTALDRGTGVGRVAFELLRTLWDERTMLTEREFDAVCERAVDLLCLTAAGTRDAGSSHADAVAASVRRFVAEHADDPVLDGPAVAAALGWSLRYVQSVLRGEGTTPTALIRDVRLDRARARLEQGAGTPIARIAAECGYANPGAFSTAFRRRFGLRPGDVRRTSGDASAAAVRSG